VFDKNLSINDDPTIPYRTGSRPCDDEGVPCKCTPLIVNGVVSNFLYDLQTAAKAKRKAPVTATGRVDCPPSGLTLL